MCHDVRERVRMCGNAPRSGTSRKQPCSVGGCSAEGEKAGDGGLRSADLFYRRRLSSGYRIGFCQFRRQCVCDWQSARVEWFDVERDCVGFPELPFEQLAPSNLDFAHGGLSALWIEAVGSPYDECAFPYRELAF